MEPNSDISLDGRNVGAADATGRFSMAGLVSGSHAVEVSHQRFENRNETVVVTSGETVSLTLELQPRAGPPPRTTPFMPFSPARSLVSFRGSWSEVESLLITNDGKGVIGADNDTPSEVAIWDSATGRLAFLNRFGEVLEDAVSQLAASRIPSGSSPPMAIDTPVRNHPCAFGNCAPINRSVPLRSKEKPVVRHPSVPMATGWPLAQDQVQSQYSTPPLGALPQRFRVEAAEVSLPMGNGLELPIPGSRSGTQKPAS